MSLWTPGGEHTPEPEPHTPTSAAPDDRELSPDEQAQLDEMQKEMAVVREQLLAAPAAVVIANHAMGVYELAAIHLTAPSPKLAEASLAIDALSALIDNLRGRLGDAEPTLTDALAQLKAAYLEVRGRASGGSAPDGA